MRRIADLIRIKALLKYLPVLSIVLVAVMAQQALELLEQWATQMEMPHLL